MARVRLILPSILAGGGERVREIEASTIKDVVDYVCSMRPGLRDRIVSPEGEINRYFNVYVNGVNVHFTGGLSTELKDGDEVSIIPALGGGLHPPGYDRGTAFSRIDTETF